MSKIKIVDKLEVKPQTEFILVKVDPDQDAETKTAGGIIIPTAAMTNKKTQTGVIVGVGEGRRDPNDWSKRVPVDCKIGDHILFACFIGYPLVIKDQEHVIIKHNDIMAIVNEESRVVEDDGSVPSDRKWA